jgi:predicted membrane protein
MNTYTPLIVMTITAILIAPLVSVAVGQITKSPTSKERTYVTGLIFTTALWGIVWLILLVRIAVLSIIN